MWTALRDEEQCDALEVRRVVTADMVDRLLQIIHRTKVGTAEHEDERAEHRQVILLHEGHVRVHVVHQDVNNPARPDPNPARQLLVNAAIYADRTGACLFFPVMRILVGSMRRTASPASWTALMAFAIWIRYDQIVRSAMRFDCA